MRGARNSQIKIRTFVDLPELDNDMREESDRGIAGLERSGMEIDR